MTPAILRNSKVGLSMSALEAQARRGCTFAQEEVERQALAACSLFKAVKAEGLTQLQATRETIVKNLRS